MHVCIPCLTLFRQDPRGPRLLLALVAAAMEVVLVVAGAAEVALSSVSELARISNLQRGCKARAATRQLTVHATIDHATQDIRF